ncbi:MAG: cyclic nucleotide-binding domain-containing protein [Caldithrix sp.]|nr:cyclic nucleotide-binding domain-containing protein [Caldithrix sp.]
MIQVTRILKEVPIFRTLGKESIEFILERLKFKTFDPNETICKVGDPGDEMFIIINGKVNICIYDENGKNEQVVATLGPGDYFGEMALLTGEPRSASVIPTEAVESFALHKDDFDVILEKYPSISMSLGKIVSKRLRDTLKKASTQSTTQIKSSEDGPSGDLRDMPLEKLISFCENNSLTGTLSISNNNQDGSLEFENGVLKKIQMGDLSDDAALDHMLQWSEGQFSIKVRPLKLDVTEKKEPPEVAKSLLIVNHSMVVRKVIERAFRSLGYTVEAVGNMEQAMDVVNKKEPDLIISDIKLPDGSAEDLMKQSRQFKVIPFVFISDSSRPSERVEKLASQQQTMLTKSQEVSEIVKCVEKLI